MKKFHQNRLLIGATLFITLTLCSVCLIYSFNKILYVRKYRELYLLQKERADAADVLIKEVAHDWDCFYDVTASGDAYYYWQVANDACNNYK